MKYEQIYEVDSEFIKDGNIFWETAGSIEYITATYAGKRYFIKRNISFLYPSRAGLPEAIYNTYKEEEDYISARQKQVRYLTKKFDFDRDHIVCELNNFWDSEKMYVTVTRLVLNPLPRNFDYSSLSLVEFIKLAKDAALLLKKIHESGVIHGNIRNTNFVIRKEEDSYIPYLTDFEDAYPMDEIPDYDHIGGSEGYESPELILYKLGEDMPSDEITTATDIFSLGVVFHRWWTKSFPSIDLEHGSVGAAICLNKKVTIDDKFDVRIGEHYGVTLKELINWMLVKDPLNRPTAEQVVDVLSDKRGIK